MPDRVFCIDFGSAFTKVALRRDPGADSELVGCRDADAEFCVPSTMALDRRGAKPVPEFGVRAADLEAGGGIEVFRNLKKTIFHTPDAATGSAFPLETLLASDDLAALAVKYGVSSGQLTSLRQMVAGARSLTGYSGTPGASAVTREQATAAALASHFFHWLRKQVMEACAKLPTSGLKYEEIPVRIAVPAFAQGKDIESHPGCKVLTDALGKVGWTLHPERPVISEPYSNAIGILTKASNVLHRSRIHLGNMFGKGPLITVLKDAAHYPSYRALVIDVGAFTTDFAALTLKPGADTIANPDVAFTTAQHSVPVGVSTLDDKLRAALPKEKAEWLKRAKAKEWDTFRRSVYTDGKGYRPPGFGAVIGGQLDEEIVRTSLAEFGTQLAVEVEKFCDALEPVGLQELILTGGGCSIPRVRDALQTAAQGNGRTYMKTHAPALKRTMNGPPVVKLDERFARGGSALGGASIYFEREFYAGRS